MSQLQTVAAKHHKRDSTSLNVFLGCQMCRLIVAPAESKVQISPVCSIYITYSQLLPIFNYIMQPLWSQGCSYLPKTYLHKKHGRIRVIQANGFVCKTCLQALVPCKTKFRSSSCIGPLLLCEQIAKCAAILKHYLHYDQIWLQKDDSSFVHEQI